MKPKCVFCKIVDGESPAHIIYQNDDCIAFLDINPTDNGHTLVIPKKHVQSLSKANHETLEAVARTTQEVSNLLAKKLNPKGFNFVINDGAEAFQEIFHYHQHIIPKYGPNEGYYPGKNPFSRLTVEEISSLIKK